MSAHCLLLKKKKKTGNQFLFKKQRKKKKHMHACTFLVTFFHLPCLKHTILESYYFFSYFPCILFLILITFCFFSFNFFTFFADLLLCIHGCKIITNSCFAYLNSQFIFLSSSTDYSFHTYQLSTISYTDILHSSSTSFIYNPHTTYYSLLLILHTFYL